MFRLTRSEDSLDDGKGNNDAGGGGGLQADKWRKALALRSQMAGSGVGGLQKTEDERSGMFRHLGAIVDFFQPH